MVVRASTFLLKVNAANVMPIIFAQAIMFIPISIVGFSSTGEQSGFVAAFMDNTGFWYNFVFAVLIILFTYFYTAITINPTQMSDDLKRNNGFIPGVKPGKVPKTIWIPSWTVLLCREHFPLQ